MLEVSNIVAGNIEALVNKVWGLEKLNKAYKSIVQKIEDSHLISVDDRRNKLNEKIDYKKIKDVISQIWREYLEVILKDPFLPKELLPWGWEGDKARNLIKKLQQIK